MTLRGAQTEEDGHAYCRAIERVLERKRPYAVLHRFEEFGSNLVAGSIIAKWSIQHTKELKDFCLGGSGVVHSNAFRFILTSFQLVTPLPAPVVSRRVSPRRSSGSSLASESAASL